MARPFFGSSVARRGMTSLASSEVRAARVCPRRPPGACNEMPQPVINWALAERGWPAETH